MSKFEFERRAIWEAPSRHVRLSEALESRLEGCPGLISPELRSMRGSRGRKAQAKSLQRDLRDAGTISDYKEQPVPSHLSAPPPGLSVRISALKKPVKGGSTFALLMDDISKHKHKRDPYSDKYLQLCLSSFVQVGGSISTT